MDADQGGVRGRGRLRGGAQQGSVAPKGIVEGAGQLVALAVALMPVAGWLQRWIAFLFGPGEVSGRASELAWTAPVAQLAFTGAQSFVPGALIVAVGAAIGRYAGHFRRAHVPGRRQWIQRLLALGVLGGFLFLVLSVAPWPGGFAFGVTAALVGVVSYSSGMRGPLPRLADAVEHVVARAWVAIVLVVFASAIAGGLSGIVPGANVDTVDFKPGVNLPSGRYRELASTDMTLWLEPCKDPRTIVVVSRDDVARQIGISGRQRVAVGPALLDVMFGGKDATVGYTPQC